MTKDDGGPWRIPSKYLNDTGERLVNELLDGADDVHTPLNPGDKVTIQLDKVVTPDFILINGEPLPRVRGFVLFNHVNDPLSMAAVRLRIEAIDEPARINMACTNAIMSYTTGKGENVARIEGILVDEAQWVEFVAWKQSKRRTEFKTELEQEPPKV